MPDLTVWIFSFNDNEEAAVHTFLTEISEPPSVWTRQFGEPMLLGNLVDGREILLQHRSVMAQGNVVSAAELAGVLNRQDRPDFFVFFGCAGSSDTDLLSKAFLVSSVSYASLGSVRPPPKKSRKGKKRKHGNHELVRLKNKWICTTHPAEATPLPTISLSEATTMPPLALLERTTLRDAHVMATDKVMKVGPSSSPPVPVLEGPTGPAYTSSEWSYAQALAQLESIVDKPVLVEMEGYGIGRLMMELGLTGRVILVRIVTDSLVGKDTVASLQGPYLMKGRRALAQVLGKIIEV